MSTVRPLRQDAARNRERLVLAAREMFRRKGLEAPLEEIAREARVAIGTLYNRFPTRDELIDAALEPLAERAVELVERAARDEDPWRAFESFIVGTFNVERPRINAFDGRDVQFLETFCREIASALHTLELLTAEKRETATRAIEKQVHFLDDIHKMAGTVKSHGERIQARMERMRDELAREVERLDRQARALRADGPQQRLF